MYFCTCTFLVLCASFFITNLSKYVLAAATQQFNFQVFYHYFPLRKSSSIIRPHPIPFYSQKPPKSKYHISTLCPIKPSSSSRMKEMRSLLHGAWLLVFPPEGAAMVTVNSSLLDTGPQDSRTILVGTNSPRLDQQPWWLLCDRRDPGGPVLRLEWFSIAQMKLCPFSAPAGGCVWLHIATPVPSQAVAATFFPVSSISIDNVQFPSPSRLLFSFLDGTDGLTWLFWVSSTYFWSTFIPAWSSSKTNSKATGAGQLPWRTTARQNFN